MADIPLDCSICPKKPTFSDVSHLLTHISSKSHLSHYYKLKVKSSTDFPSRQIIDQYDQWYAQWNIEGLMSERMSMKDKKRPRAKPSVAIASRASRVTSGAPRKTAIRPRKARVHGRLEARAGPSRAATSNEVDSGYGVIKPEFLYTPPLSMALPPGSRSQSIGGSLAYLESLPDDFIHNKNRLSNIRYQCREQDLYKRSRESSLSQAPSARSHSEPLSFLLTDDLSSIDAEYRQNSPSDLGNLDDQDKSKLKGVQWPGMAIFDSATPIARRRRNQKKEAGVLERLEAESLEVEAVEQVWTPEGNLRKEKRISGMPDSSSPLSGFTPPPPKRQRPALTRLKSPPLPPYHGSQLGKRAAWVGDEDLEQRLTWGVAGRTRQGRCRKQFQIWHDECEDNQDHEATFSRPRALNHLTRGFPQYEQENVHIHNTLSIDPDFRYLDNGAGFAKEVANIESVTEHNIFQPQPQRLGPRFSLALPSHPVENVSIDSDFNTAYGQASNNPLDYVGTETYEGDPMTWAQSLNQPVASHSHTQQPSISSLIHQTMGPTSFDPFAGQSATIGEAPSGFGVAYGTPLAHARNSSMELRNALLGVIPSTLPGYGQTTDPVNYSYSHFSLGVGPGSTPDRRPHSTPLPAKQTSQIMGFDVTNELAVPANRESAESNLAADAVMDDVKDGDVETQDLLPSDDQARVLVQDVQKMIDDDDRTITAPTSPMRAR